VTGFLDDAVLTVIRTADATTTTIPLCFRPEGVVVGGDGCHLYIADPMGSRIAVLDTTDHSMEFLAVGNQPFRMALSGADLYVGNNQDGTVSVIDTIDNALIRTIPVGGHPYAVAAGGGRVYVTDYGFYGGQSTHSVSVIDAAAGIVVYSIPVGYYPHRNRDVPQRQTLLRQQRRGFVHRLAPRHHNGHRHRHQHGRRHACGGRQLRRGW